MKSNIPPPDVDTILADVIEVTCDIFTENSNVEEILTEPLPESEDKNTAANHSFPANTSRNSETRRKRKSGKTKSLSQLLTSEERKTEPLEKGVQQKSIMSTQEHEECHFLTSLLPRPRDIPNRRLASLQVLIEEGSEESDRTEWSSGSSYYSNLTVPTPSSPYGMQSSGSKHRLHSTYSTTEPSHRYTEPPSTFTQVPEFIQSGK